MRPFSLSLIQDPAPIFAKNHFQSDEASPGVNRSGMARRVSSGNVVRRAASERPYYPGSKVSMKAVGLPARHTSKFLLGRT